jgi:hypothetical protein
VEAATRANGAPSHETTARQAVHRSIPNQRWLMKPSWQPKRRQQPKRTQHGRKERKESHPQHALHMWDLLRKFIRASIAGSVGAGRPGNAGLPTGARPVPAHPPCRPGWSRGPAGP